jgi:hypothetical protein
MHIKKSTECASRDPELKMTAIKATPEHLRALNWISAIKKIVVVRVSLGEEVDVVDTATALWMCRRSAPEAEIIFPKKHNYIRPQTLCWWQDYPAIKEDLKDCGLQFHEADIKESLALSDDWSLCGSTLARLTGYTTAIRAELDKLGIRIRFSPVDEDPLFRKMRTRDMRNKSQRERRIKSGVKPHSQSAERMEPWKYLKHRGRHSISRAQYYRLKKQGMLLRENSKGYD